MRTISPTTGAALQQLFFQVYRSGTLRTLRMDHSEAILASREGLGMAVARLTTLKDLLLGAAGERCVQLLSILRSRLVTATIAFDCQDQRWIRATDSHYAPDTRDPVRLLAQSRETLIALDVSSPGYPSNHISEYPLLTLLEIDSPTPPSVAHFLPAFPALRCLNISGNCENRSRWVDDDVLRTLNIAHQVLHGSWQSLNIVGASTFILWLMGLRCTVRWLNVSLMHDFELDLLSDVLSDSRPTKVLLTIHEAAKFMDVRCLTALCSARIPRIKTLHLCVRLGCRDADLDVDLLLNTVQWVAQVLRLTSLKLILDCRDLVAHYHSDSFQSSGNKDVQWRTLHPIEVSLAFLSLGAVARRYQSAVPTLFMTEVEVRQHFTRDDDTASASSRRGPLPALNSVE
ncbi:hypothetical protein L226DRAFT_617222 [Lentinus tigrinus ALCF2SS1-7]|nr:hypothetical protein L226DRAFT_617222 [Lentinus tigrinus ALCF2SS1-7]